MSGEIFRNRKVRKLLELYKDIWAIGYATSLIHWDLSTYMPKGAAEERGAALARLNMLRQKLFLSPEFKELLKEAEKEEGLNDHEKGVIRVLRRDLDYFEKLPPELVKEESEVTAKGQVAWEKAKEKADFRLFKPHLEKIVNVERRKAEYLLKDKEGTLYDALLDLYEEGMTTRDVDRIFGEIREPLTKLFKRILDSGLYPQKHELEDRRYGVDAMRHLNLLVLEYFGYDFTRGRLDESAHPFTMEMGIDDVRITTWYHGKDFRRSLGAVAHEFGHAIYELQIDRRLAGTPIAGGVSLGVHESQSRFWENMVWRTRDFVEAFLPEMRAMLPFLREYDAEEIYRYFAMVRPELIRVEADEVHYPLHIILRYEIERDMLEGRLSVAELPEVWNEKMRHYIGVTPPNDALGVLQDIHWSMGSIGYFPTYAIGSILSAQFLHAYEEECGSIGDAIRGRRFDVIRKWQREKIHRWGSTYPPRELVKKASGEEINPEHFLRYLERKYLA